MRLSVRHIIVGWTALAALLVVATGLVFRHFSDALEHRWQHDLQAVATASRHHLEWIISDRFKDAELLSRRAAVWQALDKTAGPIQPQHMQSWLIDTLRQTTDVYGYHSLSLYNRQLAAVMPRSDAALTAEETAALQGVLQSRSRVLVDLHLTSEGTPAFGVAQPVFSQGDPTRPLVGVAYLEVKAATTLYPSLASWPAVSDSAEALLLRREGKQVVYLSPLRFHPDAVPMSVRRPASQQLDLTQPQASEVGHALTRALDYRDTEVLLAQVPVEGTPWTLVVKADRSDLTRSVRELQLALAGVAAIMALLLAAGGHLLWRTLQAQLTAERLSVDARYANARQLSIDGYLVFDAQGRLLEVNPALQRMTGYSGDELLNMCIHDLEAAMSPEDIARQLARLRQNGSTLFRTRWRRKSGSVLHLQVSATYQPGDAGGAYQGFLRDTGPELQDMHRIQRLQMFYVFLSHANAAIFTLKSREAILTAVCRGAVQDGGFVLSWAGVLDDSGQRIVPLAAFGAAADYVQQLQITTDPALPTSQGPSRQAMVQQRVEHSNDFQNDGRTTPWHETARTHGIHASAAVPVIVAGQSVAVLNFYASEAGFFDDAMRSLLEEAAHNVALALRALDAEAAHHEAVLAHRDSEARFSRVFDASPLPMLISSYATHEVRAINQALVRTLGYDAADLPNEAAWFERVYPDVQVCKLMSDMWYEQSLPHARAGGPQTVVSSPDVMLRCRDGSDRIMRGFMTVIGDDVITQWEDMTDIRRTQAALATSEQHFRSMIEQTLTGFYVVQSNHIVYANPRFCEILGQHESAIVGRDSLEFFGQTPEQRQQLLADRERLASGEAGTTLKFTLHDPHGQPLTVGLQACRGHWNGQLANIVMVQDITERQRAEDRIADYVRQLEGTMQGTLKAVANMVDQRDPYTAGHERRVGLIAADIARAMGWDDQKCHNLQLIGLVHDIGKISVPSEILTKPTRLSALEYEMIKTHAEKGYEILKDLEFPLPIAEIIRQHHERMDGSGYPRGLKGEAILPEARILAVADVLESMASHRPYRPALGLEAALKEIEDHRGTGFDSAVVDATLRLIRECGYKLPH